MGKKYNIMKWVDNPSILCDDTLNSYLKHIKFKKHKIKSNTKSKEKSNTKSKEKSNTKSKEKSNTKSGGGNLSICNRLTLDGFTFNGLNMSDPFDVLKYYTMDENMTNSKDLLSIDGNSNVISDNSSKIAYYNLIIRSAENRFNGFYEDKIFMKALNMYLYIQELCITSQILRPIDDNVYRIVDNDWDRILERPQGTSVVFASITSTTKSKDIALDFFDENINVSEGYTPILFQIDISDIKDLCIDIDLLGISAFPLEKEIIIPGGLHFIIINREETKHTSPQHKQYRKVILKAVSIQGQIIINTWSHHCDNHTLLYSIPSDVNILFPKIGDNLSTSITTWRRLCLQYNTGSKKKLKHKHKEKKKKKTKKITQ